MNIPFRKLCFQALVVLAISGGCTVGRVLHCDATSCSGCCTADGLCSPGLVDDSACGTGGAACAACSGGTSCHTGFCEATGAGPDGGRGTDGGSGADAGACSTGFTLCAAGCVNLSSNPEDCGACGHACGASQGCISGSCQSLPSNCAQAGCPQGYYCDSTSDQCLPGCVGASDCSSPEVCDVGTHQCVCPSGMHSCNGVCASDSSPDSCGTSCSPCPTGGANEQATCSAGVCGVACSDGYAYCSGACVPETARACGQFCQVCPNGPASTVPVCTHGVCGTACAPGFTSCSGTCVDLTSDDNDCGACGHVCPPSTVCTNGACPCSGTWGFSAPQYVPGPNATDFLAVGDYNGDHKPDVATLDASGGTAALFLNGGARAFSVFGPYSSGGAVFGVAADMRQRGVSDLVTTGISSLDVVASSFVSGGTGFGAPVPYALPQSAVDPALAGGAVGDFNGDGYPDAVSVDVNQGGFWVFINNRTGGFSTPAYVSGPVCQDVTALDLDGDGKVDVAAACGDSVALFWGNGDGTFTAPSTLTLANSPQFGGLYSIASGDIDGDGKPDLAGGVDNLPGGAVAFINAGGRSFTSIDATSLSVDANAVTVADFNGDGRADIAVTTAITSLAVPTQHLIVYLSQADGTLAAQPAVTLPAGLACSSLKAVDLNADGWPDLAVGATDTTMDGGVAFIWGGCL